LTPQPYRTQLCVHRDDPPGRLPALLRDLLTLNRCGQRDATTKAIELIRQLRQLGPETPQKRLVGHILELKGRVISGGVRVYFVRLGNGHYLLGRAECKKEDHADPRRVNWFADVLADLEEGRTDLLR